MTQPAGSQIVNRDFIQACYTTFTPAACNGSQREAGRSGAVYCPRVPDQVLCDASSLALCGPNGCA
jgi:hypothetical protein